MSHEIKNWDHDLGVDNIGFISNDLQETLNKSFFLFIITAAISLLFIRHW